MMLAAVPPLKRFLRFIKSEEDAPRIFEGIVQSTRFKVPIALWAPRKSRRSRCSRPQHSHMLVAVSNGKQPVPSTVSTKQAHVARGFRRRTVGWEHNGVHNFWSQTQGAYVRNGDVVNGLLLGIDGGRDPSGGKRCVPVTT
jgi:hypothetical protein